MRGGFHYCVSHLWPPISAMQKSSIQHHNITKQRVLILQCEGNGNGSLFCIIHMTYAIFRHKHVVLSDG